MKRERKGSNPQLEVKLFNSLKELLEDAPVPMAPVVEIILKFSYETGVLTRSHELLETEEGNWNLEEYKTGWEPL